MDIVLRPHCPYATTYLDGVVIHSNNWQDHLQLREVLSRICNTGLMANPPKMPSGADQGTAYGVPHWPGYPETPREENRSSPQLPPAYHQEAGMGLSGIDPLLTLGLTLPL